MDLAVFDLDGTLVETGPDLTDSVNVVLTRHGVETTPVEALHPFIGHGARRLVEGALSHHGLTRSAQEVDALLSEYLTEYASRIARFSRPYPMPLAALSELAEAGVALAVCTNKREALARRLLEALGLADAFKAIAGGDTFAAMKPDPQHLLATIEASGGTPARTVFVGDSRIDRETARRADIPFVGLSYGYTDTPMEHLNPTRLVGPNDSVSDAVFALLRSA